jgi:hypothetical protein
MSNRMRWRYSDTNPVTVDVDSDTVVEIGDLVALIDDKVCPASDILVPWTDHSEELEEDLQEHFTDYFLGVSMQRSHRGEKAPLRVATSGVFEFDALPGVYNIGHPVSICYVDNKLCNQCICSTFSRFGAIGRVDKRDTVPNVSDSILVRVYSTIFGPLR